MSYTLFALAVFILVKGLQILFGSLPPAKSWYRTVILIFTLLMIWAAIASLINWYKPINLLGFVCR